MATFTIRVSDEMRDRIRQAAETDRRSMNAEIEWFLDKALAWRDPLATDDPDAED